MADQFFGEHPRLEDLADEPHAGVTGEAGSVADGDAGGFLPAVLLSEEGLIGDLRGIGRAPDAEQAALLLLLVFIQLW